MKYKDENGNYLAIDDSDYIRIGWFLPYDGDFGTYLGEERGYNGTEWTVEISEKLAAEFVGDDFETHRGAYVFPNRKKANELLKMINAVLLDRSKSNWPLWAIKAKQQGWIPPEGWDKI